MMNKRLVSFKNYMAEKTYFSAVITNAANIRYLSGFTGEGYLVITQQTDYLVTDFRYIIQAHEQTEGFEICDVASFKAKDAFGGFVNTAYEDISISYRKYREFSDVFSKLLPMGEVLLDMRAHKDETELCAISRAQEITDRAFNHILGYIKPGVSARSIALELEYFMRAHGASSASFDIIAATGAHGAMPHAEPDERKVQKGDFVVLDFGCVVDGYCSDMTRTVCAGKATDEMKRVYNTVLEAQLSSLEMICEGVVPADVHKNAAAIIDRVYPGSFGHGLGHGVGLDIHEKPNLSPRNTKPLKNGNVVTVEPGIYLEGFCGVRIEDMVAVCGNKCTNLTHSDKKLIEL